MIVTTTSKQPFTVETRTQDTDRVSIQYAFEFNFHKFFDMHFSRSLDWEFIEDEQKKLDTCVDRIVTKSVESILGTNVYAPYNWAFNYYLTITCMDMRGDAAHIKEVVDILVEHLSAKFTELCHQLQFVVSVIEVKYKDKL